MGDQAEQQQLMEQRDALRQALRTAQKAAKDNPEDMAAHRAASAAGLAMGRFLAGPGAGLPGAPRVGGQAGAAQAATATGAPVEEGAVGVEAVAMRPEEQQALEMEDEAFAQALAAGDAEGAKGEGGKTKGEPMAWVRGHK